MMAHVPDSFDDFVAANGESLLRTAHLVTMDEGEAEDLVQECLLILAQRWRRIGAMEHPLAYARRVLVNLAVRGSAKLSRRRAELDAAAGERYAEEAAIELVGMRDELWTALRELTPHQRAVLVLRYFHDLSERHVAEIFSCATGTVSSTNARSLARLRELIEPPVRSDQR